MPYLLESVCLSLLLAASLPAPAKTLENLLLKKGIPSDSFSLSDLESPVWSSAFLNDSGQKYLAYLLSPHSGGAEDLYLVRFDSTNGKLLKSTVHEIEPCSGALGDMTKIDDYFLVPTNISPSASCLLVLNKNLAQTQILNGFGPNRVGQNQIIFTESMIHFAPVHPERLKFADLRRGATTELYPPKGDPLRAKLARENAKHMPSHQVCMQMNNACDPKLFDESINNFTTDGQDRFALLITQSASYAVPPGEPAAKSGPQWVIYIYVGEKDGWKYCQKEISGTEAASMPKPQNWKFQNVERRCTPDQSVIPDMSAAIMNPFCSAKR